jgi:hypothetical protein
MVSKQQELEEMMNTSRAEANESMVQSTIHRRSTMKRFIIAVMFAAMAVFATDAGAISIPINATNSTGVFTDTFPFPNAGSFIADLSLINTNSPINILTFSSVTLNGNPLTISNIGTDGSFVPRYAFTPTLLNLPGPLTLIVNGTVISSSASYGGTLNLTSVPEPASLMLLGAGLAGIGIWRRKAAR